MTGEKNRFKTTEKLWDLDDKQLKSPKHDAMVLWLMDENNAKQILAPLTCKIDHTRFINRDLLDKCEFDIKSEIPLQSSNGFINGYADLVITRTERTKQKYHECRVSEALLEVIKEAKTVGDLKEILAHNFHITEFTPYLEEKNYRKSIYYDEEEWPIDNWEYISRPYQGPSILEAKLLDFFRNFCTIPPEMSYLDFEKWIKSNNYYTYQSNHIKCLIEVKPHIDSFGAVLRQINSYRSFWNPRTRQEVAIGVCLFTLDTQFDNQFESQNIHVLHPPEDVSIDDMLDMYGLR